MARTKLTICTRRQNAAVSIPLLKEALKTSARLVLTRFDIFKLDDLIYAVIKGTNVPPVEDLRGWHVATRSGIEKYVRATAIKRCVPPTRKTTGRAGNDLYNTSSITVQPWAAFRYSTGLTLEIPDGIYGQIHGRSGHHALMIIQSGVVDQDYTGEVFVNGFNMTDKAIVLEEDVAYAQIIFREYVATPIVMKENLLPEIVPDVEVVALE